MKNVTKETETSVTIVRVICALGAVLLTISDTIFLVECHFQLSQQEVLQLVLFGLNVLCTAIFLVVLCMPKRVGLLAVISLMYTFFCIVITDDPMDVMGLFMYFLSMIFLLYRGYFYTHQRTKLIISLIIVLCLYLTKLRFGVDNFIQSMIQVAGYSLVFGCIFYFYTEYMKNTLPGQLQQKVLDLSKYDENELSAMDREWIEMVLTNEKYDTIARKYNYSLGHVKNRMRYIFATIDVLDRIDLFSKYAGCVVIKNAAELDAWKKRTH